MYNTPTASLQKGKLFVCIQFKCQTVLFDTSIGLYQVLPLWTGVDLGTMAMKMYSAIPKDTTICHNKPPDRKWGRSCGWRHAQKRWSWKFEDLKKTIVEFSAVEACGWVFRISTVRDLKTHKMRRALGVGSA